MNPIRYTLWQLMAIVGCLGFGFAALRNADALWASITYNLAFVMVAGASIGAIARKGRSRASWAGFAVFGFLYLIGTLPAWSSGGLEFGPIHRPTTFIEFAITQLQPFIKPLPAGTSGEQAEYILIPYQQISFSIGVILFGYLGAIVAQIVAAKDEEPDPHSADSR